MIGVYGGTFDPVHYGHLRTALEVREALDLDEIRFVPCRIPPHRRKPFFSAGKRLELLKLATADEPGFVVDTRELARPGPSYMVDTLASLRREAGDKPLCLIVGLDAFLGLPGWHRWQDLFELAHLVVMDRPGYRPEWPSALKPQVEARRSGEIPSLRRRPAGRIFFQQVTRLEISATYIRQCLLEGKSPRYLLPDRALALIKRGFEERQSP